MIKSHATSNSVSCFDWLTYKGRTIFCLSGDTDKQKWNLESNFLELPLFNLINRNVFVLFLEY